MFPIYRPSKCRTPLPPEHFAKPTGARIASGNRENPTEHVGYVARTDDKRPVQCATILGRLEKVELYNIYIGSPPKIPENGTSYTCNALRYLHKSRKHTMRYL